MNLALSQASSAIRSASGATPSPLLTAISSTPSRSILDTPLAKSKPFQVSSMAFSYLFMTTVQYCQAQSTTLTSFETRLHDLGYAVSHRLLELSSLRETLLPKRRGGGGGNPLQIIDILMMIHTTLWKVWFGKTADALEQMTDHEDEFMISDDEGGVRKFIAEPKEWDGSGCTAAFTAGMVRAVLVGYRLPARVTAHAVPTAKSPQRTTILIKFDPEVMERRNV